MPSRPVTRHSDRAFSVDALLSAAECTELIELSECRGFAAADVRTDTGNRALPQVRNNQRAMFAEPVWAGKLWLQLQHVALPELDGQRAVGLPRDLRFYKYSPGQRFKMHKDGPWREDGLTSRLTLLVYLNDDFAGGETDFREFQVLPRTGSALLFVHDTWHEGVAVTAGTKYVLRSDVLYR